MENIFNRITGGLPKPPERDVKALSDLDRDRAAVQRAETQAATGIQYSQPQAAAPARKESLNDVIKRWQKTGDKADAQFILKKMKPTISAAMTSFAKGMDNDLAIKAAKLTLNSLKTFDPSYNVAPATYVFHGLKRLSRYGAQKNNIIYMSEDASREHRYIMELTNRFIDDKGREPSIGELADLSGYNTKKVERILDENLVSSTSSSLSTDDQKSILGQKDTGEDDYFEYVYASCGPIDQKILEWTSGRHGKPKLSNMEIAKRLHISAPAVSQRRATIGKLYSEAYELV